ncbi:MAG: type II secretion system F family protein [Halofilum sp. (in: g-proteobacteria)]|nr:type II secretion system F family protein [Halofilum sp. (in: g-proteobacteria)]
MQTYKYKAVDSTGRAVRGTIDAANLTDLEMRLSRMGLDLVQYRQQRRGRRLRIRRTSRNELINFSFHLEQLLNAGVPMVDALSDIGSTIDDPAFRDVVAELVEAIEGGSTFSEALAAFPHVFGNVYISMVRVGEQSGRLVPVLRDLAAMIRWQDEMISYAKRVMVYPAIVLAVVGAVVVFLMIYLVPQLTSFLATMGAELPAHTRALIAVSGFLVDWWFVLLAVGFAVPFAIRYLTRNSPRFRYQWDLLKLHIWLFGPLNYKIRMARFANYFALMYTSGITVLEALRLSRALMDNVVLEGAIHRVQESIAEGETISEAFSRARLFPPLIVRMMRVGETSGALDEALHNVSYFYSREVRESVERLQPAIQPVLTVILGALVGWIMFSVIGPIYDTISTLDI